MIGGPEIKLSKPELSEYGQKFMQDEINRRTKSGIYTKTLVCTNCGERTTREIPEGVTVKWYIETHECKNCGCDNLAEMIR